MHNVQLTDDQSMLIEGLLEKRLREITAEAGSRRYHWRGSKDAPQPDGSDWFHTLLPQDPAGDYDRDQDAFYGAFRGVEDALIVVRSARDGFVRQITTRKTFDVDADHDMRVAERDEYERMTAA